MKRYFTKASAVRPTGFLLCGALTLSVLLSFTVLAGADRPTISSITFRGNHSIDSDVLLSWLQSKIRSPYAEESINQDVERILAGYAAEGYFFARVDSVDTTARDDGKLVDIMFRVNEGSPCILTSVTCVGNRAVESKELLSSISIKPGDRFVPRMFESDLQRILHTYEQNGYPFAKISIQDISLKKDSAEVSASPVLSITEGELARLTELRIEGNESTKDYVIAREARLSSGELFRGDLPAKIKRRLQRLQLFSSVSTPELYLREDGTAGLLVRVTEGNQNHFDGVLGYVPSSRPDEEGTVTGLVDVQFRNVLGTGRRVATRWYRENRYSQEIELRYLEPWVASYPVNVQGDFFQRKQDSTYVRRRYEISGELMMSEQFTVGLTFSQANVFPSQGQTAQFVAESKTTSYALSAYFDSRDDIVTPFKGIVYHAELSNGAKTIEKSLFNAAGGSSSTRRLSLNLEHFFSPIERQVVAFSVHLRDFRSASIEQSDLFRIGGATTLRGYREAQFLGSRLVWSNLEYRFLVGLRSFAYAFLDAGHIELSDRPEVGLIGSTQNKLGYGIGLRMDSALGLIGVSLALGEGDTFSTAKLHFRLVNEF